VIYARQPTDDEMEELQRMVRRTVGRVSQRAQMVLWSVQRKTVPEIADLFAVCRATVRFWLRRFNALGPEGLYDRERSGRPPKFSDAVTGAVLELVRDDPQQAGYLATCWTVAMLVLAVFNRLKVRVSASTLRGALHQLDLRWGRPRLGMPLKVDPQKAQKQWAIARAAVGAPSDAVILYADEARFQLLPLIRAMWQWVGQQVRVPTPGTNVTRAAFGALNIRSGAWTYLIRERMRKEDFVAFLEHLLTVYPSGLIILIADNYSSHTAHVVRQWLDTCPRLQLHFLPKYCSHLNPVEGIWLQCKNHLPANRLYGSMNLLLDTIAAFFSEMTPQKALTWAAV
jgi:transposase